MTKSMRYARKKRGLRQSRADMPAYYCKILVADAVLAVHQPKLQRKEN